MSFFKDLKTRFHIDLNAEQKAAVLHKEGPALVLAGPGSGKTTLITARTAFLALEYGIPLESIMTVTYNKAAQLEMKHRFEHIFGSDIKGQAQFTTFHSLCYSVIRDYERRQGNRFKLIESEQGGSLHNKQRIIKDLYKEINGGPVNEDELETLQNEIGLVKNRMIKEFDGLNLQTRNFAALFKAYEEYKRQNLLIDFDDMLSYAYAIFLKCPDILQRYKGRYPYFQVDEGQDLSLIQFEILKLLVSSKDSNLFLVADDDQSIYGFRGAEPRYILELNQVYPNLSVFRLEQNYRSSRNIVELSSAFIKGNKRRYEKCHRTENSESQKPQLIRVTDEKGQLDFIEKKLKENQNARKPKQVAVLYRSNLSSIPIVDRLERAGIPFRLRQNKLSFFVRTFWPSCGLPWTQATARPSSVFI
ncbi:MAG: ATP-dependent helicase [Clostridia bacterium]|nr:ATP-dependent helicase [Clostridia bacterium]